MSPEKLKLHIESLLQDENFEDAVAAIEQLNRLEPLSDAYRITQARCHAKLGRITEAREEFLSLALGRKITATQMLQVAKGLADLGCPDLSMRVCEWVIESDESHSQAYFDMGVYSAKAGEPLYLTEALTHRAIQLDPTNAKYRFGLIALLVQLGRDDEVAKHCPELEISQVDQICCVDCLKRVKAWAAKTGYQELAAACHEQLADLMSTPHTEGVLA
ncbi:MAG: tetratricopeptide repeat protein [Planctomycetota bacterium]